MRNTNHKTIITTMIITLLVIVGTILIMMHNKPASQTQAQPTATSTHTASPTPSPTVTVEQLTGTAIRFEQQARNWGTDPNLNLDQVKTMDQATFLNQTRLPDITVPDLNQTTILQPTVGQGPEGPSPACQTDETSAICNTYKTAGEWWRQQAWATGTRWVDGPHVTINGNMAQVTGQVRSMLIQPGDSFHSTDYWAITPAWQTNTINDTLTFTTDGRISSFTPHGANYWWVNPWYTTWDDSMANSMATAERVAIPVKGQPAMNLYPSTDVMRAPQTQADLDGIVDWRLWDGICLASCNSKPF